MNNMAWASPQALGRLTIPQLLCLTSEHAPDAEEEISDFEGYTEALARKQREISEWDKPI